MWANKNEIKSTLLWCYCCWELERLERKKLTCFLSGNGFNSESGYGPSHRLTDNTWHCSWRTRGRERRLQRNQICFQCTDSLKPTGHETLGVTQQRGKDFLKEMDCKDRSLALSLHPQTEGPFSGPTLCLYTRMDGFKGVRWLHTRHPWGSNT